jgi:O-antigen/teichoic acid export membrane protein
MRRDLASAYFASVGRILSWVVVSALVYRTMGAPAFAMLALVRGTIGLLNYVSLGLAPALIHHAAGADADPSRAASSFRTLYSNALSLAYATGLIGILISGIYATCFPQIYSVPHGLRDHIWQLTLLIGIGTILRFVSDAPGAVLQLKERIALDNTILAAGDLGWMVGVAMVLWLSPQAWNGLTDVGLLYAFSGVCIFAMRLSFAAIHTGINLPASREISPEIQGILLRYGALVVAAQLADYLYSPTDYILIARLLSTVDIANYAPAVQIDSGLLLVVSGLAAVLLPKAALAYSKGSIETLRRYYLRGTFASAGLLLIAALALWVVSPWLFKIWFGNSMPGTQAILPLVLVNTVVGGSGAVGRSILLAVGKARAFAVSVLVAGVVNVICSYCFVHYLHWGLNGIVLGTVVAVVGRCVIWMPWYITAFLRHRP